MDRCLICHRKLKDAESKKRGIGGTCWRRVMKVAVEERARKKLIKDQKRRKDAELKGQTSLFEE